MCGEVHAYSSDDAQTMTGVLNFLFWHHQATGSNAKNSYSNQEDSETRTSSSVRVFFYKNESVSGSLARYCCGGGAQKSSLVESLVRETKFVIMTHLTERWKHVTIFCAHVQNIRVLAILDPVDDKGSCFEF